MRLSTGCGVFPVERPMHAERLPTEAPPIFEPYPSFDPSTANEPSSDMNTGQIVSISTDPGSMRIRPGDGGTPLLATGLNYFTVMIFLKYQAKGRSLVTYKKNGVFAEDVCTANGTWAGLWNDVEVMRKRESARVVRQGQCGSAQQNPTSPKPSAAGDTQSLVQPPVLASSSMSKGRKSKARKRVPADNDFPLQPVLKAAPIRSPSKQTGSSKRPKSKSSTRTLSGNKQHGEAILEATKSPALTATNVTREIFAPKPINGFALHHFFCDTWFVFHALYSLG